MKKEIKRKKDKHFYINGFTLVELLVVIAILAIIGGIIVYTVINVINSTKDKSYEVTIRNIENVAMEYAIENQNNIVWHYNDVDDSEKYYCVNIQKLIDTGYFKEDILDSYIDKDILVNSNDYIYLEIDSNTMTLTKKILLSSNNNSNYSNLCNNVNGVGNIDFKVEPYELSGEKKITIDYKLLNIDDNVSNYKYHYQYVDVNGNKTDILGDGIFDKTDISKEITVNINGTIKAQIKYNDEIVANGSLNIDKIDDVAPVINIKVTNGTTYAKKKDAFIELKDSGIGFKIGKYNVKYGWSTSVLSCSDLTDSVIINISNNNAKIGNAKITIDGKNGAGKLYACADNISDYLGNLMDDTVSSKEVYLDNIGPVIELSNNNSQNVFANAVIPIKVSDTYSGVDGSSFDVTDISVSVGDNILTSGVTLERIDNNNYNLKISNYNYTGQVKITIGKDKVLDMAGNGNNEVVLSTNVIFENKYMINYTLNGGTNGSNAPTSGIYNRVVNISNPEKTVTVIGNENGTGATVGNATSGVQTFAGWTASELNTSTAYYGTSSGTVLTQWSNGTTKVTSMYFKNLRNTSGTVTLTANWTAVAFNLPTVTKTGYTCGWATTSNGSKAYDSGASYTPSTTSLDSVTLYAVCTVNTYDVYFVSEDSTISGGITLTNMVTNGSFEAGNKSWELSNARVTNQQKYTGSYSLQLDSGTTAMSQQTMNVTVPKLNHKYYGRTMFLSSSSFSAPDNRFEWFYTDANGAQLVFSQKNDSTTSWKLKSNVLTQTSSAYLNYSWYIRNFIVNGSSVSYVDDVMIIDLTDSYGAGSELTNLNILDQLPFFDNTLSIYNKSYVYGSNYGALPTPTRSGYTFVGWNTKPDGSGTMITNNTNVTTNSAHTLYAVWQINNYYFDLNWNLDGNDYQANNSNGQITAGVKIGGVDKGYISNYYVEHPYGTTWEIYGVKLNGTSISYSASGTVGASNTSHKININTLNIGVNNSSYGSVSVSSLYVLRNTTYSSSGNILTLSDGRKITATVTNATGYTTNFSSWSSSSGTIGSATKINANFNRTINTYTVTTYYYYYYQNTTWTHFGTRTDSVTYGSSFAPYNVNPPTGYHAGNNYNYYDSGYNYLGGGTVGTNTFTVNQDMYVHVHYYPNTYTISYNANGGSGAPGNQTKTYGVTLTLFSTVPTRDGYTFLGWSTSSTATSATYSAGGSYTSNSGTTLYAVWKLSKCIPNFTFNGSYQIVDDSNNAINDINNWRGNWKIRFLSSGTLTFTELNCASSGIDIFVVGGGGNGASGSRYFAQNSYGGGSGGGGGAITVIKFPASANVSYGIGVGGTGSNSYFANGGTQYYTAVGGGTPAQPYYCGYGCDWVRPTGGGGGRLGGQTSYYGASNVIVNGGASGNGIDGIYEFNGGSGIRYGASGGYGGSGASTGYGGRGGSGSSGGANGGGSGGRGCSFTCSGENCSRTDATSGSGASDNTGSGGGGGGSACGSGNESYGSVGSGGSGGSGIVIIRNTR